MSAININKKKFTQNSLNQIMYFDTHIFNNLRVKIMKIGAYQV